MRSHRPLVPALALAVAIGALYPYLERAWKCREGMTGLEACVWSRAYFPLSRWIEPIIVTPIAFLIIVIVARLAARLGRPKTS